MEIRNLKTFVAVAELSSFSDAARMLGLCQSAVSMQVKALEDELHADLFTRTPRAIALTESGDALLARARGIIKSANETLEYINSLNGELCGELRIGVGSFIEPYIRKAATRFFELYPKVRLFVHFDRACELNRMLRNHDIDLAFTMNHSYNDEGIETMPCIPFHLRAIMSDTHVLARKEKVCFSDFEKHSIIMPDVGERVFATIRRYNYNIDFSKMKIRAVVNAADALLCSLKENKMITFLPSLYVSGHDGLVALPIEGLEGEMMSNAHWLKDTYQKKSAQAFIDIIKDYSIPYFKNFNY